MLFNMTFDSGVVLEDWRSAVTDQQYKDEGEGVGCKN